MTRMIDRVLSMLVLVGIAWVGAAVFNPNIDSGTVWFLAFMFAWIADDTMRLVKHAQR